MRVNLWLVTYSRQGAILKEEPYGALVTDVGFNKGDVLFLHGEDRYFEVTAVTRFVAPRKDGKPMDELELLGSHMRVDLTRYGMGVDLAKVSQTRYLIRCDGCERMLPPHWGYDGLCAECAEELDTRND